MARPILVSTLVLAAFGVGYGARNAIDWRGSTAPQLNLPTPDVAAASTSDEIIAAPEGVRELAPARSDAGGAGGKLAPSSPPAQASVATPGRPAPSTGMAQLAYAPVLPEPPGSLPGLSPPAPPLPPVTTAPPQPAPVTASEPSPPKLAAFPPTDIDAMRETIAQMRKGDVAAADAAIRKMSDPVARTLGEWALIRSGQRAVAFPRILAFIEKNADWPTQPLLQRRAEEAIAIEQRPVATVRGFFEKRTPLTVVGRIAQARALLADKRKDEAFAVIRYVWREDTFSAETEQRLAEEFAEGLRREDHRARMERHIFKEMLPRALVSAQRAGAEYASLVRARQAVESKSSTAKAMLDAVPKGLRTDSSFVFANAQFLRRAEKPAEAAKALEGLTRDPDLLVDGDEWWVERRMLTRKLLDLGDAKLAYKVAAEHGGESDAMRVEAEFHAGWIALRFLKDAKLAASHFEKAADAAKMPMSVSRVAYWQGRAAEAAGDPAAAQVHYRKAASLSGFFYGQLSRAKLPADDVVATGSVASRNAAPALENDPALRAIDLLLTLNERDLAMSIVVDMAQRSGSVQQLDAVGEMLQARRDARGVLVMGKLAMQRGVALDRHAFPTFGIPTYQPLAELSEPAIVHSIARQESAFDPKAVSHAGARGLMQLMPATARMTANRYKTPFDHDKLTGDPSYNAQIGAAHLSDLLEEWRGSYILVFAAYNAGSHNVKKWIAAYGDPRSPDIDPIDWIERIPFTETRNYVQRIMENMQVYRGRLTPGAPLTIEADLRRNTRLGVAAGEKPAAAAPGPVATR